jgi:hypothetical protein
MDLFTTKEISVKATEETRRALNGIDVYVDMPKWSWILLEWINEADKHDTITLTYFRDFWDKEKSELNASQICSQLERCGIPYTRTLLRKIEFKG